MTATDAETGIASVTLEQLAPGAGDWATICTDTTAPYTCAWSTGPGTGAVADGQYSLRARATDNAGYETVSDSVRTTVANNMLVVLASPGDAVRGSVPLVTSVYNAPVSHTVRVDYAPSGSTSWKPICQSLTSPYTCTWDTTKFSAGDYDLRSVLTAGSTTTVSAIVEAVTVDNAAPSVTMLDPGTPLSGTRSFSATATDADSGVANVVIQQQRSGTSTWQDLCSIGDRPVDLPGGHLDPARRHLLVPGRGHRPLRQLGDLGRHHQPCGRQHRLLDQRRRPLASQRDGRRERRCRAPPRALPPCASRSP